MSLTRSTFDMASLLDSDEAISEYLSQVLADGELPKHEAWAR